MAQPNDKRGGHDEAGANQHSEEVSIRTAAPGEGGEGGLLEQIKQSPANGKSLTRWEKWVLKVGAWSSTMLFLAYLITGGFD